MNFSLFIFGFIISTNLCICWPTYYYYSSPDSNPKALTSNQLIGPPYPTIRKTIFVVHGQNASYLTDYIVGIRNALLKNTQNIIIVVDWSEGTLVSNDGVTTYDYQFAAQNIEKVGKDILTFIRNNRMALTNIYCLGHSLGAHVCGHTGKAVSGKIWRITGLNPDGPQFTQSSKNRLMSTDATFVDVIHTDSVYGTRVLNGHLDFFPNFADVNQPLCSDNLCNHISACKFFERSLNSSCKFTANLCTEANLADGSFNGCNMESSTLNSPMGYYASKLSENQVYVIKTDDKYCQ